MSLNLKNSTVGVDVSIQLHQSWLYKKLKALWTPAVDDTTLHAYGRVYRNANDKGYVPEIFVSSGEDNNTVYAPVIFDKTTMKGMFFYTVEDQQRWKEGVSVARVSAIFIVNVALIKPTFQHRADEEIRNQVRVLCSLGRYELAFIGDDTGFANVFRMFTGLTNKDGEVFEDRHPIHCFKMNFELNYLPAEIKC